MFIFDKQSKKGVKIFVPKKKFFEKKVTRGSLSKKIDFKFNIFDAKEKVHSSGQLLYSLNVH